MGASTQDLFGAGAGPGPEPATPGSYGEAPRGGFRLPAATRLGPVHLQVADLARALAFYEGVLGLRVSRAGARTRRWAPRRAARRSSRWPRGRARGQRRRAAGSGCTTSRSSCPTARR
jgi:hypothetical protein